MSHLQGVIYTQPLILYEAFQGGKFFISGQRIKVLQMTLCLVHIIINPTMKSQKNQVDCTVIVVFAPPGAPSKDKIRLSGQNSLFSHKSIGTVILVLASPNSNANRTNTSVLTSFVRKVES